MILIKEIRHNTIDIDQLLIEFNKDKWGTLEQSYTKESVLSFISNPNNYLLVAYVDDNVVGVLEAYNLQKLDDRDKEMLLYSIETKKEYRNMGVAKSLILKLRDIAVQENCHEIWILTEEENINANHLYQNIGIEVKRYNQVMYNYPLK